VRQQHTSLHLLQGLPEALEAADSDRADGAARDAELSGKRAVRRRLGTEEENAEQMGTARVELLQAALEGDARFRRDHLVLRKRRRIDQIESELREDATALHRDLVTAATRRDQQPARKGIRVADPRRGAPELEEHFLEHVLRVRRTEPGLEGGRPDQILVSMNQRSPGLAFTLGAASEKVGIAASRSRIGRG